MRTKQNLQETGKEMARMPNLSFFILTNIKNGVEIYMQLKNTFRRIKFKVRMLFTDNEITMRRLDRLKDSRINQPFYDKLLAKQKSFRQELLTEGLR